MVCLTVDYKIVPQHLFANLHIGYLLKLTLKRPTFRVGGKNDSYQLQNGNYDLAIQSCSFNCEWQPTYFAEGVSQLELFIQL